jgi:hypothetical protein
MHTAMTEKQRFTVNARLSGAEIRQVLGEHGRNGSAGAERYNCVTTQNVR